MINQGILGYPHFREDQRKKWHVMHRWEEISPSLDASIPVASSVGVGENHMNNSWGLENWRMFIWSTLRWFSLQFAIEHGPVQIVDLSMNNMVIFHSYVNVYRMLIGSGCLRMDNISQASHRQVPGLIAKELAQRLQSSAIPSRGKYLQFR